jgi:hypothetical protein
MSLKQKVSVLIKTLFNHIQLNGILSGLAICDLNNQMITLIELIDCNIAKHYLEN